MSTERREPTVEYYANEPSGRIHPDKIASLNTNEAIIHPEVSLISYASACSIVLIYDEENKWSVYHGAVVDGNQIESYEVTLVNFLANWQRLGIKASEVFVFGASPFHDDIEEDFKHRDEILRVVRDSTKIDDDKLVIVWNDLPWGETDVILDPRTNVISVIFDFCEEEK